MNYSSVPDLAVELNNGVLSLTFNRPDSLNSLTEVMLKTAADTLDLAATDPQVKVVRLGGAGRGFSSGAGISAEDQAAATISPTVDPLLAEANRVVRTITALPKPVVAVVHGPAAGVGVSLALACDVVLASE
jgi:enoyl-CoA hydratase